jgi:ubiquinone biosynthesis protein
MVQVEGVSRALDPQHDMWAASRPIVERWVQRELGAEAVAKRAIDEAALSLAALRRLPQTLAAVEAAARKVSVEAPREERQWYQMPVFWIGMIGGGLLALVLTWDARRASEPPPRPAPEPARMEAPAAPLVRPSANAPIPPVVDSAAEPLEPAAAEPAAPAPDAEPSPFP